MGLILNTNPNKIIIIFLLVYLISLNCISISKKLVQAGKILGIEIIDYLIVNANVKFISLKERGYIQGENCSPFFFMHITIYSLKVKIRRVFIKMYVTALHFQ